ncbi:hypothetical protein BO221_45575 [Archangium sp. Cb G35]|uniref:DUF6402 family protein n=1 Tax=Archangium sp. Cb G35 TaxID=1920190 RepID=UPI000936D596|nr:DUF6402 family protein [Archangium sp. Cb G35]OJT17392.1 hypothetical protein BO221_45575 [Archangium sp. Cb G35]
MKGKCLQCQQDLARNAVKAVSEVGQKAGDSGFDITEIPAVMDKLKGVQGARFMRRWFESTAYELPMKMKTGELDARMLSKAQLLDDLPFSWLEDSKRVGPIVKETVESLSEVREFNSRVGKTKGVLDQLSRGLIVLMGRLETLGLLDAKKKRLVDGSRYFGDLPAIELDRTMQFNRVDVGTSLVEKAFDALDDVYFALGAFSIKLAATQFRTYAGLHGYPTIEISEVGMYLRDTYDFLNKKGQDQLLGYWNKTGVIKPDPAEYLVEPKRIYRWFKPYFRVMNSDYNAYRRRTGKGGDFMVFSTVKRVPVSIQVHLSDIDFDEYLGRKGG